jgi:hypothetical protein
LPRRLSAAGAAPRAATRRPRPSSTATAARPCSRSAT